MNGAPIYITLLAILGLLVNRGVDFVRNAFDKEDRIPKAWWLLAAWAIGIGLAYVVHSIPQVAHALGLPPGADVATILTGFGFGSVAGFWHELLSAFGSRTTAETPKGLAPRPKS